MRLERKGWAILVRYVNSNDWFLSRWPRAAYRTRATLIRDWDANQIPNGRWCWRLRRRRGEVRAVKVTIVYEGPE